MSIVTFPFVSGLETGTDKAILADGKLADAQNVEMDRLGRLRVRPRFVAQGTTSFTGGHAHVSYDLFTLNERLFSIRDSDNKGHPVDIFEFCQGEAATWKPTSTQNANLYRLPRCTKVRELVRGPEQPSGITSMGGAAFAGYACLCWTGATDPTAGYVQAVKADTNQPLIFEKLDTNSNHPCQLVRLVGLADRLFIVGTSSDGKSVSLAQWIPASQKRVTQVSTGILTSASAIGDLAVCKVGGADRFAVVAGLGLDDPSPRLRQHRHPGSPERRPVRGHLHELPSLRNHRRHDRQPTRGDVDAGQSERCTSHKLQPGDGRNDRQLCSAF